MALSQYHKRVIQRLEVVCDFKRRLDAEVIKGTDTSLPDILDVGDFAFVAEEALDQRPLGGRRKLRT